MNAAQIIEQIKQLPAEQRAQVENFVRGEKAPADPSTSYIGPRRLDRGPRHMGEEDFHTVLPGYFQRHRQVSAGSAAR